MNENNSQPEIGGRYAKFALALLVVVYIFNFIDRQILSVLAEDIKADLGLSDSDLGFLFGTAFAVFYSLFGIPLGKLADVWSRKKLIDPLKLKLSESNQLFLPLTQINLHLM